MAARHKVVHKSPLQRLSGRVAQRRQLERMSWADRGARTCEVCDITYMAPADAAACQRWHYGTGD